MMDKDRLDRRVHGRKEAREVLRCVDLPYPDHIDAFIDEIVSTLRPPVPVDKARAKIERERAYAEFANYQLKFGQHNRERLENAPREYLEWLRDSTEETLRMVGGYLDLTEDEPT